MRKFIIINNNGKALSHFPDVSGSWLTLCCLDGYDDDKSVNQSVGGFAQRVNCPDCIAMFDLLSKYSECDIDRAIINGRVL